MELRYKTLALSSLVLFSFYFIYDFPAALNKQLKLGTDEFQTQHISMLYSVYAFPNMIVPIFFGYTIRKRVQSAMVGLCFLVFLGQTIFSVGVFFSNFYTMLLGRFIYGIGGESFSVIQSKLITEHFEGKELALSMAITNSIARCGTISNFLITPLIAQYASKTYSCLLGSILTATAVFLCIIIQRIDKELESNYFEHMKNSIRNEKNLSNTVIVQKGIEPLDFRNMKMEWDSATQNKNISYNGYKSSDVSSIVGIESSSPQKTFLRNSCNAVSKIRIRTQDPKKTKCDEKENHFGINNQSENESMYDDWSDSCIQQSYSLSDSPFEDTIYHDSSSSKINEIQEGFESPEASAWAETIDENLKLGLCKPFIETNNLSKNEVVKKESLRGNITFQSDTTSSSLKFTDYVNQNNSNSPGFSLLVGISFMFAVSWAPYSNIATVLLQKRYGLTTIMSGRMLAIQEGMSLFLTVILGFLCDLFGQKLYLVGLGGILMILGHIFLFNAKKAPLLPICFLSFAGPLISCYWPCITYLVTPESVGGGFAIFTCILNIAYTVSPLVVSTLVFNDPGLQTVEFFIIGTASMAFVLICLLSVVDRKHNLRLNRKSFSNKQL